MLRKEMRRRGESFKQVLNNAIRAGLRNMKRRDDAFEPLTFDMGKPRVDLTKAASLAAELEDDDGRASCRAGDRTRRDGPLPLSRYFCPAAAEGTRWQQLPPGRRSGRS